ncbi:MAG: hypothetical protein P4L79_09690 [Legionella sp.]|uniref:hypothetical protein n=1 Tax=Legionella sp. TaxID=459 RepID=UPI00284A94B3|nr:hypothetical protein [Legionella sp.]
MMKFILIADEENANKLFFPIWEIMIFVVVVSFIFYLLFPRNLLQKTLETKVSAPVVLNYLRAWEQLEPENPELTFAVLQQEANLGLINEAQDKLALLKKQPGNSEAQTQIQWIEYLMLRYKTDHAKLNTKKRIAYLQALKQKTSALAQSPLSPDQLKTLALDSQGIAQSAVALKIFNRLKAMNELKTPEELAMGGTIAMGNNAHENSAEFYKTAYQLATNNLEKRKYALQVIKVLWAGNRLNEALSFAEQLPEAVINDRDFLLYISHLAVAANQPKVAEKYALKALLTNENKKHE